MALMLLLGTSSAWAANKYTYDYIFLDLSGFTSWASADATFKVGLNTWDNTGGGTMSTFSMTKVPGETYIYYANVSSALTSDRYGIKFSRCSPSGSEWNSFFSSYSSGNCGKPSDWNSGSITTKTDVYCISAPTFGEVEVGQSATSSGTYLYAGVSTIPEISNNSTEFQYVAGSSSITTNGSSTITVKFTPSSAGDKTGTLKFGSYLTTSLSGTGKVSCTPSATLSSAVYDAVNNEIDLSGSIETCDNNLFYGFLWKNKEDANWNTANAISGTGGSNNNTTEDIDFNQSWDDFTPGDTYEFTAYALDATTNPYTWYYSTDENNVIEVSTCTSIPDNTYVIAGNNEWTGNANPVTINYDANTYGTPTISYNGEAQIPTDVGTYAITINVPAHNGYCASTISLGDYEITCIDVEKPAITTSATVCAGTQVTLSNYNGVNTNTVKWYSSQEFNSEVTEQVTLTDNKDYYAKAYHAASGCSSSEYSTLAFTVNPLPTISISGNNSAVLYEDVELTAATDGTSISWEITEGDGSLSSTTGNSVTLTSSSVGTVTVTAKAFLNGCESAEASHPVTFSAEDCNSTTTQTEDEKTIEIWCRMSDNSNGSSIQCYGFGAGNFFGSYPGSKANNGTGTYNSKTYQKWKYTFDSKKSGLNVIFNTNGDNDKTGDISVGSSGKRYYYWYNKSSKTYGLDASETIYTTTTTPAQITAPAAKTISVSTTDGEGNIIFSGQVVKTGCDDTNEYGFQYSLDEQTWTTVKVGENAAAGTAIYNNTVKGLDGTYHVRAYITNDNSTQYGAITEITVSTKKTPITSVVLTHVKDVNGTAYEDQELENLTYCVGDEVWFELNYVGSTFIPENNVGFKWTTYPGSGLIGAYNGNKYKFTITGSGTIGIRLRNDANVDGEGNPTWAESNLLEFNTHPEPTAPTISFAKATICSNDNEGATLKLGATVSGQAYELWKYENDDDTEGSKVANVATLNCTENNQELQFTGIKTAGKYFVKTYYTAFCNTVTANSSYATLTVVNAKDVSISITPATATTTPWMPVKLTISATDDYTLEVPDGVEFSQKGDICSVKIPLPQGANGGEGQYENVSFPQDATTSYIVTAKLVSTGGEDNPCAVPETATITLTPYVEECTIGH